MTTGIHFHGINQVSTNFMDGPSMVTQCPLPPGSTMTYQFTADVGGTYWYHSHNMGQYPDGLRGPMIIHDPNDPYVGQYDEEYILTLSDWYHEETITLVRAMLSPNNTQHTPPLPQAVLVNDGAGSHYPFVKGKTYRFRIISFAAFAGFMIHFDSHDMNVIMNDVVSTATTLIMFPEKPLREDIVSKWRPSDDSHFESPDGPDSILPSPDQTIVIDFTTCFDSNGIPRSCINQKPYIEQKVPTLYTAVTTGDFNTDPAVYGQVNPFIVSAGSIVDIVVNNHDVAIHPFHLHGHHFQILRRPSSGTGDWPGANRARLNNNPPYRDTVSVMGNSHAVLRYKADNPGVYLFHCHIEWHVEMGLTATIIEAPEVLRELSIPQDHLEICKSEGIPTSGNAGGNSEDPLDTSNFNSVPPLVYNGALWPIPSQTRPLVKAVRAARVRA
ncbi:Multicopper oxidase PfmaD like protein [Verticillium longisporum]|uniref:Multicopper oxidase PfmaD like protein n=1 Tax=Verticillium longisporum TaxID=100787 RepID=A0A8I2ZLH7_VERLO|nr:Multicopper oxidase PfmaD like protein [Verticillium longisporum]